VMAKHVIAAIVLGLLLWLPAGCGTKPEPAVEPDVETQVEAADDAETEAGEASAESMAFDDLFHRAQQEETETEPPPPPRVITLKDIHFEFDKFSLTPEARRTLSSHARELGESPSLRIQVEGHCDERGTQEYNLALGQRRAQAVKDYLISSGVQPSRISIISYGEERPLDPRSNEEAWGTNRRAHFKNL